MRKITIKKIHYIRAAIYVTKIITIVNNRFQKIDYKHCVKQYMAIKKQQKSHKCQQKLINSFISM